MNEEFLGRPISDWMLGVILVLPVLFYTIVNHKLVRPKKEFISFIKGMPHTFVNIKCVRYSVNCFLQLQ